MKKRNKDWQKKKWKENNQKEKDQLNWNKRG